MTTNIQDPRWKEQTPSTYNDSSTYDNGYNEDVVNAEATTDATNSEVVRSQIDATRGRLSDHLDKIQERLQPENIKQHAQDAIQSAVVDSMGSVKEYVDDYIQQMNWTEVRDEILDTVRRNPVPVALVGVGLGWMLINSTRGSAQSRRQPYRASSSNGSSTQPSQHGLGWREDTPQMESPGSAAIRASRTQAAQAYAMPGNQGKGRTNGDSINGGERADAWQSDSGSITGQVKETIGEAASQLSEGARQVKSSLYHQAANVAEQVQNTAGQIGEGASDWAEQWELNDVAGYAQRTLEENPLLFGAIALAVGAGLGMLLPGTNYENQLMGNLREQTVEKAQGVVEEVKERAQTVIKEVQPEIEKAASNVVKNVEEAGKQAYGEVRQSLQNVAGKLDAATDPKSSNPQQSGQSELVAR